MTSTRSDVGAPLWASARCGALLLLLTATAAATDAISYLGLGRVFPANMTGNTVLLGVGLATGDQASAARSAVALGGFVLGAATAGGRGRGRKRGADLAPDLLVELALLLAVLGWWLSIGGPATGTRRLGLIALVGLAMGQQSGAIARLDVGVATTYITGTWTAVSSWFGGRLRARRTQADDGRQLLRLSVLACYFGVACAAAFAFHEWGPVTSG